MTPASNHSPHTRRGWAGYFLAAPAVICILIALGGLGLGVASGRGDVGAQWARWGLGIGLPLLVISVGLLWSDVSTREKEQKHD